MERTTTGNISRTNANDTAKALCWNPRVAIHRLKMNSAATIEGTPASTSTMKVVTRANRPEPYSTRYTAVIKPSGTARTAATPACTSDPYSAWYTPPANSSGSTPRSEWVHQLDRVTAYQPRATTTASTQTSGTNAMSERGEEKRCRERCS